MSSLYRRKLPVEKWRLPARRKSRARRVVRWLFTIIIVKITRSWSPVLVSKRKTARFTVSASHLLFREWRCRVASSSRARLKPQSTLTSRALITIKRQPTLLSRVSKMIRGLASSTLVPRARSLVALSAKCASSRQKKPIKPGKPSALISRENYC